MDDRLERQPRRTRSTSYRSDWVLHLPAWRLRLCQRFDSRLDFRILTLAAEFLLFKRPTFLFRRARGALRLPLAMGHPNRVDPDRVAERDRMRRSFGASCQGSLGIREAVRAAMRRRWRRLKPTGSPNRACAVPLPPTWRMRFEYAAEILKCLSQQAAVFRQAVGSALDPLGPGLTVQQVEKSA